MGDDEDFDADAFRAVVDGDTEAAVEEATTANHAAAEGVDASADVGSESTLREMLLSSDPEIPLTDVEDPWNPQLGGTSRIYRGIMKMTDVKGMPALGDLLIGAAEAIHAELPDDDGGDQGGDQEDEDDGRSEWDVLEEGM